MHLQLSYIEPRTKAQYPEAVLMIENVRLQLEPPVAELDLALYVDAVVAQDGPAAAFERRLAVPLTQAEIASLRNQFAGAVYRVLLARREFQAAQAVP